ncbi:MULTISPECIES: hypothetical protein [Spirosoma]|uniref:hypothetical protein n=1 Tax=Spirosoma TaxID=107 RepID=UPI0013747625|nr:MULTISPECIES: hypothetical protein [Spirosoma]
MITNQTPEESLSEGLYVVALEERLETVELAAEAAYTSCVIDFGAEASLVSE